MKLANEVKLRMIIVVLVIAPAQLSAKTTSCFDSDKSIEYLDEKVVFCFSKDSLRAYINMLKVFDLDGMNNLVLKGKCNFIPNGEYLPLESYKSHTINSVPVIATKIEGITLWTFRKLVSEGDPANPVIISGKSSLLALAKNYHKNNQCH